MKHILKAALCLCLLCLLSGCRHGREELFLADTRINDKPVRFAYDTGAGVTLLHARSAKRLGVQVFEPPSSAKAATGKVAVGRTGFCKFGVNQENYTLKLATVHLPWPWSRVMDLDGVIGWPDLKDDFFAIDARSDAIRHVDQLPQDTNGWIQLRVYRRTDVMALEIPRADGKTGVLEVDTGNPGGVSVSPALWREWRASHSHARGKWRVSFMPGSGTGIGREYQAEDLRIGPLAWKKVEVHKANRTEMSIAAGEDIAEGSIGIAALRQFNCIIDQRNHLAYLRPNADWGSTNWLPGKITPCITATNSTVGFRFRERECLDLGVDALEARRFDEAISNATRLLELNPDNATALALRGAARFTQDVGEQSAGKSEAALSDLNRALKLDPDNARVCYVRGIIYYAMQRWQDAVSDFQRFCELVPDEAIYPRFYLWVLRTRAGEQGAADQELSAFFGPGKKPKAGKWEKKIGAFLLGRMSESEFLGAARRGESGWQCEAWFYAGIKRRVAGDIGTARDYFQKCLDTGKKEYDEFNFATAELKALDVKGAETAVGAAAK